MWDQFNKKTGAKMKSFKIDDLVYFQVHRGNESIWNEGIMTSYKISTDDRTFNAHANKLNNSGNHQKLHRTRIHGKLRFKT